MGSQQEEFETGIEQHSYATEIPW